MRRANLISRFWLHLLLTPLALLWLAPLWLMVVFSTVPEPQIFSTPVPLLPGANFMANFRDLQADTNFLRTLLNSVRHLRRVHAAVAAADEHGRIRLCTL